MTFWQFINKIRLHKKCYSIKKETSLRLFRLYNLTGGFNKSFSFILYKNRHNYNLDLKFKCDQKY